MGLGPMLVLTASVLFIMIVYWISRQSNGTENGVIDLLSSLSFEHQHLLKFMIFSSISFLILGLVIWSLP